MKTNHIATTLLALAMSCASLAAQAPAKPPQDPNKISARYHVIINTEAGLVCEVYQPIQQHTAIPTAQSRAGGGGGVSFSTTTWQSTGRMVFLPHTKDTTEMELDHQFYASTRPAGRSERISPVQVVPVLQILKILPPPTPPARQVAPSGTTRPQPPLDPFKKGR
jgi:hypothetical protein